MEEDLQMLDEYEEMHRVAAAEQEDTRPMPASRRMDAQSQAYSTLHYRRMDLMAALIQKTEQYSKKIHILALQLMNGMVDRKHRHRPQCLQQGSPDSTQRV